LIGQGAHHVVRTQTARFAQAEGKPDHPFFVRVAGLLPPIALPVSFSSASALPRAGFLHLADGGNRTLFFFGSD
jgi:hypothetical protein